MTVKYGLREFFRDPANRDFFIFTIVIQVVVQLSLLALYLIGPPRWNP